MCFVFTKAIVGSRQEERNTKASKEVKLSD